MSWLRSRREGSSGRGSSEPLSLLGRDLSVAFVGQTLAKGLTFVTFLVMTRALHPDEYGLFMLAYSVFEIALYLSDLGLDTGTTRFVSKGIRGGDDAATERVLMSVFTLKLVTGVLVFVVGFATAPFVATEILKRPLMVPYLRLSYIGIFGAQLGGFYRSFFGARLEFDRNAVFNCLAPVFILAAMGGLWWTGHVDPLWCVGIYSVVPALVCFPAMLALPHAFLKRRTIDRESLRSVWRFSRWIYLTNVLSTVRFRLNSILLARLATFVDVGIYNYGDKLAATLTLFTDTLLTVLVPRASHLVHKEEIQALLKRSYAWMAWLLPLLLVVPFGSRRLIALLSPQFVEAAPIFSVLFVSILFTLLALPSRTILYSINRPDIETGVEVAALALTFGLGWVLVRSQGALGAAITMLVQRAFSSGIKMVAVWWMVYRRPDVHLAPAVLEGEG